MRLAVLALLVLGCTPDTPGAYTYPGCDGGGSPCTGAAALLCAFDRIEAEHSVCGDAGACAAVRFGASCYDNSSCHAFAVAAGHQEAFLTEVQAEAARFCDAGACEFTTDCGPHGPDVVACLAGQCTWLPDGGP